MEAPLYCWMRTCSWRVRSIYSNMAKIHMLLYLFFSDVGAIVLLVELLQLSSEVNLQQHVKNTPAPILVHLPHCRLVATTGVPLLVKKEQLEGEEASWFGQLCLENTLIVPLMVGTKSRQEMNAPEASIADAR